MKRLAASVVLVATLAASAGAAYLAGADAGRSDVWQYIGPGDTVCDTDIPDVPDCWSLPTNPDMTDK